MAQKEITLKVNIEGQDIVLTGKQVELLQGNLIGMREELTKLGERTEENGEKFDKLRGDIEALEKVFGETKEEVKETGDAIQNQGKKTEESGKKTESYAKQIKEARIQLIALGERTADNAEQYDFLTSRIQQLSDQQEDLQFGTKKLDDALASIPGPIGQAASAFKGLDDGLKNLKSAFATVQRDLKGTLPTVDGIKKGFSDFGSSLKDFKISDLGKGFKSLMPTLDGVKSGVMGVGKALAATGIGAIAIVVGLLTAAFIKLLSSSKPLQDALGRFGTLFETLMDFVKPLVDIIANGLVAALDGLARGLAFVTGQTDEFNKKLADKKAAEDAKDNLNKLQRSFEANADKYDEYTQRKMKADLDYQAKVQELREAYKNGEIKTLDELNQLIADFGAKRNREIASADKDRADAAAEQAQKEKEEQDRKNKEAADRAKAAADKRKQIEEDYQKRLKSVRDENTLMEIADENERAKKALEIQRDAQLAEIAQLEVTDAKKLELKQQTEKKFALLEKQRQDKVIADQKKADEDLLKTIRDGETARIENEFRRREKEAENRKKDELKALQDSKASADVIAKAKLEIENKYQSDLKQIKEEEVQDTRDKEKQKLDIQTEIALQAIDEKLKAIDLSTQSEFQKIAERDELLRQQRQENQSKEESDLLVQLQKKEITQEEYNQKFANITKKYANQEAQAVIDSQAQQAAARKANRDAIMMLSNSIGSLAQAFGEESKAGKALIKVQQALALSTTIMAIADQFAGLGKAAKLPFPANIVAIATFLATIGTAIVQFKNLFGKGPKDLTKGGGDMGGGEAGGGGGQNLGTNYARGGMIGGKRHAQGGTLIEAEQGEAIMTRGAVTMFRPMLSMMNQMGGGTSFNSNVMTRPDAPSVSSPAEEQAPMIMKTYVVSNELTTEAEKQARLKDLSTL